MKLCAAVLCLTISLPLWSGCSKADNPAGANPAAAAAEHKQSLGAIQKAFADVVGSLASLKDPATAEQGKAKLEQQIGTLKQELAKLDAKKLGAMWTTAKIGLQKAADDQVAKYKNDPELQKKIEPYIAQLKMLLNGA